MFSASSRAIDWLEDGREVSLEIDMMPGSELPQAEKKILSELLACPQTELKSILKKSIPGRLTDVILDLLQVLPQKKANQVTSDERKKIATLMKSFKSELSKDNSFEKAQITRGGVSVKDMDPRTMESKKIKGLYFAGEMIDVDGDCGGFNLQAAFSTGRLAGRSAGEHNRQG